MKIRLALLLTHDPSFEQAVTEALKESRTETLVTHAVDDALEKACRRITELDLVVIDRDDCHAITLLSAIQSCRRELPVIVIIGEDTGHCAALAYAMGAAACLVKPVSNADLKAAVRNLSEVRAKLVAA